MKEEKFKVIQFIREMILAVDRTFAESQWSEGIDC